MPLSAILMGFSAAVIWSAQATVAKIFINAGATTFDVVYLRVFGGFLFCLPFIVFGKSNLLRCFGWRRNLFFTLCFGAPFALINTLGLHFSLASHGGLISLGLVNFFAVPLSFFVLSEKVSVKALFSIILIFLGLVLFSLNFFSGDLPENFWIGDLCFLIGAICWATGTTFGKKWQIAPMDTMLIANFFSVIYLPFYWVFSPVDLFSFDTKLLAFQALYQGLLVSGLGLFLFLKTVEKAGVAKGTVFTAIPPFGSAVFAGWLLSEIVLLNQWLGLLCVSTGIILVINSRLNYA